MRPAHETLTSSFQFAPSPLTRRGLISGALASAAAGRLAWAKGAGEGGWVLLGGSDPTIYRARWNARTGELGVPEPAVATPRPTYFTLHPRLPVLYACNELDGEAATVSAFHVDRRQGTLTPLGAQPTQQTHGGGPCFASVDRKGKLLFVADYGGGNLAVFPIDAKGSLGPAVDSFSCVSHGACGPLGPNHERQEAPHLHCATVSPDNRAVLACDLGDDAVLVFPLNPPSGHAIGTPLRVAARAGSGPRHLAFHPSGDTFYCIHELDCTVEAARWPKPGSTASPQLLPESVLRLAGPSGDVAHPNTGAEVAVSRDGRFLYASTRGIDQLTVASLDVADHTKLSLLQQVPCGGRIPRFFALDPSERWLLCAHQEGGTVAVFARDAGTGRLTPQGSQKVPSPMCVVWL